MSFTKNTHVFGSAITLLALLLASGCAVSSSAKVREPGAPFGDLGGVGPRMDSPRNTDGVVGNREPFGRPAPADRERYVFRIDRECVRCR